MTMKQGQAYVRIRFELEEPDEHGWPPAGAETLWAQRVGDNEYEIDNIPFYVRGVSAGDIVSVSEKEGALVFQSVLKDSGHSTIRVIIKGPEELGTTLREY